MLPKVTVGCPDPKQSGREINTVGVPQVEGQQWAALLLEMYDGRRAREQEAEKLRPHWPLGSVLQVQLADGVVLAQPLHRDTADLPRSSARDRHKMKLKGWLHLSGLRPLIGREACNIATKHATKHVIFIFVGEGGG